MRMRAGLLLSLAALLGAACSDAPDAPELDESSSALCPAPEPQAQPQPQEPSTPDEPPPSPPVGAPTELCAPGYLSIVGKITDGRSTTPYEGVEVLWVDDPGETPITTTNHAGLFVLQVREDRLTFGNLLGMEIRKSWSYPDGSSATIYSGGGYFTFSSCPFDMGTIPFNP